MSAHTSQSKDLRSITLHFLPLGAFSLEELGIGHCVDYLSTDFHVFHLVHVLIHLPWGTAQR